jgi:prepilin-type processing-associated H-X9-DG protein
VQINSAGGIPYWYRNEDFVDHLDLTTLSVWYPKRLLCPDSHARILRNNFIHRSYGMNMETISSAWPGPVCVNLARVRRPSMKFAFADALDWWIEGWASNHYLDEQHVDFAYSLATAFRHRGRVNAAFYDGHVESLLRAQIDTSLSSTAHSTYWKPYQP